MITGFSRNPIILVFNFGKQETLIFALLTFGNLPELKRDPEELGITLDEDAFDAESDGSFEPGDEAFIFSNVVGDLVVVLEAELDGVVELVACW